MPPELSSGPGAVAPPRLLPGERAAGGTDPRASAPAGPASMVSRAVLHCDRVEGGVNRLTRLRSHGQIVLRPTQPKGFEPWASRSANAARVSVSAGTAGPLGGDRLSLDVHVGDGAVLVLNEISATVALPGTSGDRSVITFSVRVDRGATLIWLPEPVIAARGCDHRQEISVELAADARFFLRESLITGRYGEEPGDVQQHVRVLREGVPVYDQNLRLGPGFRGWDSPAVTDRARAVGSMIVVDPGSTIGVGRSDLVDHATVSVGLEDDVVQVSAVAPDSLELARSMDEALSRLGPPWAPDDSARNPGGEPATGPDDPHEPLEEKI